MPDERHEYGSLPIPTYEEATSSQPLSSSPSPSGRRDAEEEDRRYLLGDSSSGAGRRTGHGGRRGNYQRPTVESERPSFDSDFTTPDISSDEDEELRRDVEEMDIMDGPSERRAQQRRTMRLPKPLDSIRQTLSSMSLPSLPSAFRDLGSISSRLPFPRFNIKVPWPIIARLFGLFLLISLVYALMVFRVLGPARILRPQLRADALREYVKTAVDTKKIEQYLWEVSFDDHIAGTKGDFFLASEIKQQFMDAGLDAVTDDDYEVYLNYPKKHGRRVAIVDPPDKRWVAKLEEDTVPGKAKQHPSGVFHGHSKSGDVTGPLIYANYGSREDFEFLKTRGVDFDGAIVLVRYYGTQGDRALKINAAERAGAAGCLIFSDSADDGALMGDTYPAGRWRPKDAVQRGAVTLVSWIVGDVLTPGWASTTDTKRIPLEENPGLVNIPSLPLAWRDAKVLLDSLRNAGEKAPKAWNGSPNQQRWIGSLTSSPTVNLKNLLDDIKRQPIRNIIGEIQGLETPEKIVYVGNHRDAWCFGAVDPGSGTAVMLEVVRILGRLKHLGWHPRRTIRFASWDAGAYNMIGSTEHVENRIDQIRREGVAYINIDGVVSGDQFWAAASPLLRGPLLRVLDDVVDPKRNVTLRQRWNETGSQLGELGAGSDYVAFQHLAGCSSIDLGFQGPKHGFPSHSCYDSFNWMKSYGDPEFTYHAAAVQVLGLLILELADDRPLRFDMTYYAEEVERHVKDLKQFAGGKLNVQSLQQAAKAFTRKAKQVDKWEARWAQVLGPAMMETRRQRQVRVVHNDRLVKFESNLLDLPSKKEKRQGGVPGRNQFKHVIFGPQAWSGHDKAFPAVRDAVEEKDWDRAQTQLEIAAKVLGSAVKSLSPN